MSRDKLDILMSLRTRELDAARRGLGEALAAEDRARMAREAAAAAIVAETDAAVRSPADYDVERFARWLVRGKARLGAAESALAEASAATAHQRAELALLRAAAEATEQAIEQRDQRLRAAAARVEQRELDETGLRKR